MVSVCCLVYNHEKYLKKCLDGFVMQKTNFKFEVLIHDDASIDKSADIIREYEKKYPDIIKPIYQTENQYSKGIKISSTFLFPRAKGKYLAWCEGDDYWCDEYKLQRQYDVMEHNPNCSICVHEVYDINEEGKYIGSKHPPYIIEKNEFSLNDYLNFITDGAFHPFQTSSYFIQKEVIDDDLYENLDLSPVGDVRLVFASLANGNLYYLNNGMSCYRNNSIESWSNRVLSNKVLWKKHQQDLIKFLDKFDECTGYVYKSKIYRIKTAKKFYVYSLDNDFKSCLKIENLKYFFTLSKKYQLFVILEAYFPSFMKLHKRVKDKIKCLNNY